MKAIAAAICIGLAPIAAAPLSGCVAAGQRAPFTGDLRYQYLDAEGLYDAASAVFQRIAPGLDEDTKETLRALDHVAYTALQGLDQAAMNGNEAAFSARLRYFREAVDELTLALEGAE